MTTRKRGNTGDTTRQPPPPPAQPVDTMLMGSLQVNAERPGRCAECHGQTTARRVLRTTYAPPTLNRREQEHLSCGDMTEAAVIDRYLQRVARRQLRGDLGTERRTALCPKCATRWLVDCLENGPGARSIPGAKASTAEAIRGALALMSAAIATGKPLFAAVLWQIERGPDGRSQVTSVMRGGNGAIAPQILLRAIADMRRYAAHEWGRSLF